MHAIKFQHHSYSYLELLRKKRPDLRYNCQLAIPPLLLLLLDVNLHAIQLPVLQRLQMKA